MGASARAGRSTDCSVRARPLRSRPSAVMESAVAWGDESPCAGRARSGEGETRVRPVGLEPFGAFVSPRRHPLSENSRTSGVVS